MVGLASSHPGRRGRSRRVTAHPSAGLALDRYGSAQPCVQPSSLSAREGPPAAGASLRRLRHRRSRRSDGLGAPVLPHSPSGRKEPRRPAQGHHRHPHRTHRRPRRSRSRRRASSATTRSRSGPAAPHRPADGRQLHRPAPSSVPAFRPTDFRFRVTAACGDRPGGVDTHLGCARGRPGSDAGSCSAQGQVVTAHLRAGKSNNQFACRRVVHPRRTSIGRSSVRLAIDRSTSATLCEANNSPPMRTGAMR